MTRHFLKYGVALALISAPPAPLRVIRRTCRTNVKGPINLFRANTRLNYRRSRTLRPAIRARSRFPPQIARGFVASPSSNSSDARNADMAESDS
jgi:hypothetical protein